MSRAETQVQVERFTTEYIPSEDRVRFTLATTEGQIEVLWLTYRMLSRLVPALVEMLEEEGEDQRHSDSMQSFSQAAARQQFVDQAPVRATQDSRQWLVTRIDMTPVKEVVNLVFFDEGTHKAQVALPLVNLRQWMGILKTLFDRADWSTVAWPEWLEASSGTAESGQHQIH